MPTARRHTGEEVEYVEVRDEPLHRRQFNNQWVYAYVAGIKPGETSLWHRHSENTLYVCLTSVDALNRPLDKEEHVHHAKLGDVWWAEAKLSPYVHQVCISAESARESHFFGMEVLQPPPVGSASPLDHRCYSLRPAETRPGRARVYSFALAPGESTGMHTWGFYGMVLSMREGSLAMEGAADQDNPFAATTGGSNGVDPSRFGGWKWVQGPVTFGVRNTGHNPYEAVVVEWVRDEDSTGARL